jgi:hypothetical protein
MAYIHAMTMYTQGQRIFGQRTTFLRVRYCESALHFGEW